MVLKRFNGLHATTGEGEVGLSVARLSGNVTGDWNAELAITHAPKGEV